METYINLREPQHRSPLYKKHRYQKETYRKSDTTRKPNSIDVGTARRSEKYEAIMPRVCSDTHLRIKSGSSLFTPNELNSWNKLKSAEFDCIEVDGMNTFEHRHSSSQENQDWVGSLLTKNLISEGTFHRDSRMSSIKRDFDYIHTKTILEKDQYIDKIYNELVYADAKSKRLIRKY